MTDGLDLDLRPVRPADRERVLELAEDLGGGRDYLPDVFDEWATDPGGLFQAAEVDGIVVAVQRTRPIAPGILFYEGLRVAADRRRQGIARTLVRRMLEEASGHGFREVRLTTFGGAAAALFESEGFRPLTTCVRWFASRVEGGDPPRLGSAWDATALVQRASEGALFTAYGGVLADWGEPLDVDTELVERLAADGRVRVGPSGQAAALLLEPDPSRLRVGFLTGQGAALRELLEGLRFEADLQDLRGVSLWSPEPSPAGDDLEAVGYHLEEDSPRLTAYARELTA
ncbi:MAG TPA: GNAT family N-acetyltransferase [Candidatus Binatia bacterium]|nr:GNAT family N-acetyltransferase [Candidatus Binatia bacterium]